MEQYPGVVSYAQQRAQQNFPTPPPIAPPASMQGFGLPPGMMPPQAPQQKQQTLADMLIGEETKRGQKLTPEEAQGIVNTFKVERFMPKVTRAKGAKALTVEADIAAFDSRANRLIEQYMARPFNGPPKQGADPAEFGLGAAGTVARQALVDPTISFGMAAAEAATAGPLGLADYLERGKRAALMGLYGLGEELVGKKGQGTRRVVDALGARTMLGDAASWVSEGIQAQRDAALSPETLFAQGRFSKEMQKDPGVRSTLAAIAENPSVMGPMLGETLAFLMPGAALRTAKLAKFATAGGKTLPVIAGGAPAPIQAGVQFEDEVLAAKRSDLLKDPLNQATWDSLDGMGLGDSEREAIMRRAAVTRGLPTVFSTSAAANIGLPLLTGGLAPERIIAGTGTKIPNAMLRMFGIGGAQVGEEAAAGATERIGENIAGNIAGTRDVAPTQGATSAATIGGVLGGLVGTAAGVPGGSGRKPLRKPPAPAPTAAPAAIPPTPAENVAADTAPAVEGVGSVPGPNVFTAPVGAGVEPTAQTAVDGAIEKLGNSLAAPKRRVTQTVAALDTPDAVAQWVVGEVTKDGSPIAAAWPSMTGEQRADTITKLWDTIRPKAKGVKAADVAPAIAALRDSVLGITTTPAAGVASPSAPTADVAAPTITPPAPAVQATAIPADVAAAVAGPQAEATPVTPDVAPLRGLRSRTAPKTKGLRRPKDEAPAPAGDTGAVVQAPEAIEVAEPDVEEITLETPPDPVRDPIKAQLQDALPQEVLDEIDQDELADAIALARENDVKPLSDVVRKLQKEGVITPAQAASIRVVQNSLPPQPQSGPKLTAERGTAAEARQGAEQLTGNTPQQAVDWLRRSAKTPFEARLSGLIANRLAELRDLGVRFFFNVSTDLDKGIGGQTRTVMDANGVRVYVALNNQQDVLETGTNYETAAHEFIHAVTSATMRTKPDAPAVKRLVELHQDIVRRVIQRATARSLSLTEMAIFGPGTNVLTTPNEILSWGLTNENFQAWLAKEQSPRGSFLGRLFDTVRDMLGVSKVDSSLFAELLSITDTLLTESLTPYIAEGKKQGTPLKRVAADHPDTVAKDKLKPGYETSVEDRVMLKPQYAGSLIGAEGIILEDNRQIGPDEPPVTTMQRFIESFAQRVEAFRKSEHFVHANGGLVTPETSPSVAMIARDSDTANAAAVDNAQVIQPIVRFLTSRFKEFASTPTKALERVNDYFLSKHTLERMHTWYLLHAPLKSQDNVRDDILDGMADGDFTPTQARKQLEALLAKDAIQPFEAWADKHYTGKKEGSFSVKSLNEKIAELSAYGVTDEAMGELNELMDAARKRTQQHLSEAGKIPEGDPWVEFYGWKHYVPLKGAAGVTEREKALDYDGPEGASALKKLRESVKTAEKRSSLAESPFTQLLVDLTRAGATRANTRFNESLYEYVLDNAALLRAKISTWTGNEKAGYSLGEKSADSLPKPNGFVYSSPDGQTHSVVELPEDSQLLRGITKLDSDMSAYQAYEKTGLPFHWIAGATNLYGRLKTTLNPLWVTMVAAVRDISYMPAMTAAQAFRFPHEAAGFFAKYGANLAANMADVRSWVPMLTGNLDAIMERAKDEPTSMAAWLVRYRESGGASDITSGYNLESQGKILEREMAKASGLRKLGDETIGKYVRFTDRYANTLETLTRVAAFKALRPYVDSDKAAATTVKNTINYQQSGAYGRLINAFKVFFRISATGVDVMRTSMLTKTGEWDKPKAAAWAAFMAGAGALWYTTARALMGVDEDDDKPYLAKMQADTLTQAMILPTGEKGDHLKIANGLGLPQVLSSIGILGAALASGDKTPAEVGKAYMEVLNRNSPARLKIPDGSGIMGVLAGVGKTAIPSVLEPMDELRTNESAFGRPIHTTHPDNKKHKSEQGKDGTPTEFKAIAKVLREHGNVDMYPEDIAYIATSYGGSNVRDVIQATIAQQSRTQVGLEDTALRTTLRVGANDIEYYYQNELYKTLDQLVPAVKDYAAAKEKSTADGEAWLRKDPDRRARVQAHKQLETAQRKYYKGIAALRAQPYTVTGRELQRKRLDSELRRAVEAAQAAID